MKLIGLICISIAIIFGIWVWQKYRDIDVDSHIINIENENLSESENVIIPEPLLLSKSTPSIKKPKISVASMNMASKVLSNVVGGTEAKFVAACKAKYPKYDGWHSPEKLISECSYNSARIISNYDIFGLQEVPSSTRKGLFKTLIRMNHSKNLKFFTSSTLTTGYDENVMGKGIPLTRNMKMGSRVIQAIWFPERNIIFINLHAEHHVDLVKLIEYTTSQIKLPRMNENFRVLMTGDFNDRRGQLIKETVEVFGKKLRIPSGNKAPKTCCYRSFGSVGDYVLDSEYYIPKYFGIHPGYDFKTDMNSDHLPAVMIE